MKDNKTSNKKDMEIMVDSFQGFHFFRFDFSKLPLSMSILKEYSDYMDRFPTSFTNGGTFSVLTKDLPCFLNGLIAFLGNEHYPCYETLYFDSQESAFVVFPETGTLHETTLGKLLKKYEPDIKPKVGGCTQCTEKDVHIGFDNSNQTAIVTFKFNRTVVDVLKSINGCYFNPENKTWILPKNNQTELQEKLSQCNIKFHF